MAPGILPPTLEATAGALSESSTGTIGRFVPLASLLRKIRTNCPWISGSADFMATRWSWRTGITFSDRRVLPVSTSIATGRSSATSTMPWRCSKRTRRRTPRLVRPLIMARRTRMRRIYAGSENRRRRRGLVCLRNSTSRKIWACSLAPCTPTERRKSFLTPQRTARLHSDSWQRGSSWNRPADVAGTGVNLGWISEEHAQYLRKGGIDGFIGDGFIHAGIEVAYDLFYSVNFAKGLWFTGDYQHIANPAFNTDRGPLNVFAIRIHGEF